MTRVTLIAALGRTRVIGDHGEIPWRLSGEQGRFKDATMGHTLVMGRATFEAMGRVLPGRRTIVLSRQPDWHHPAVETAHSFEEALALAGPADEIFVAGGGEVYAAAMPYASRMVLSEVHQSPPGDTFFPEWAVEDWRERSREEFDGWTTVVFQRR